MYKPSSKGFENSLQIRGLFLAILKLASYSLWTLFTLFLDAAWMWWQPFAIRFLAGAHSLRSLGPGSTSERLWRRQYLNGIHLIWIEVMLIGFTNTQWHSAGFSQGRLQMGGNLSPLHMGGQSVNGGGTHKGELIRGNIDLMGRGPNFDRLFHKLKALLMLSCDYMMQFIDYDSIKTCWFISYHFQIRTITQHQYKRIRAINHIM